ncbi:DNAJ heat shock N-terminal domain-containing protein [Chytriomyces cf. hyalinus JEL632]|nr:DNAJ heat shock N-terminal domain-containing protein [Chytriomyces cf. hyalinus JEL632]
MSHYDSLGLSQSATTEAIKKRYQRLILQLHPDKNSTQDPQSSNALQDSKRAAKLQLVLKAWEVLRDQDSRTEYDASLAATGTPGGTGPKEVVNGEVDLDDMTYNADSGTFQTSCRCSGSYVVSEQDLEDGVEVVSCTTCSLRIRVLYSVMDE